jgi:hypothetical protein
VDPFIQIKTKLGRPSLCTRLREKRSGSRCVSANSTRPALEYLHSHSGQLDQCSQDVSNGAASAVRVPERFPCLVSFPVVASVEQLNASQVLSGSLPSAVFDR